MLAVDGPSPFSSVQTKSCVPEGLKVQSPAGRVFPSLVDLPVLSHVARTIPSIARTVMSFFEGLFEIPVRRGGRISLSPIIASTPTSLSVSKRVKRQL